LWGLGGGGATCELIQTRRGTAKFPVRRRPFRLGRGPLSTRGRCLEAHRGRRRGGSPASWRTLSRAGVFFICTVPQYQWMWEPASTSLVLSTQKGKRRFRGTLLAAGSPLRAESGFEKINWPEALSFSLRHHPLVPADWPRPRRLAGKRRAGSARTRRPQVSNRKVSFPFRPIVNWAVRNCRDEGRESASGWGVTACRFGGAARPSLGVGHGGTQNAHDPSARFFCTRVPSRYYSNGRGAGSAAGDEDRPFLAT